MSDKLDLLKAATRFLYSKKGPDYGEDGGCGDTVKILLEVAGELRLRGVEMEFGHAYFPDERDPAGDPNAHAWLLVDGKRFDPSQYARKFKVLKYEIFDPEVHQSDLLECIIGFSEREIEGWAAKTLQYLEKRGFVSRR